MTCFRLTVESPIDAELDEATTLNEFEVTDETTTRLTTFGNQHRIIGRLNHFALNVPAVVQAAWLPWAALAAALFMPLQALSWCAEGHQVIAKLAEFQLTPKARAEVNHLLAQEPDATMASVSTWADEHKSPGYLHLCS
jgi:hypothetical protein